MKHNEIINALTEDFKIKWGATTEVEWMNSPSRHANIPYVKFHITFTGSENACLGNVKVKHSGLIIVQCFTEINEGYGSAYNLTTQALDLMQNMNLSQIFTYAGSAEDIGKDPIDSNLYNINAVIPFEAL